MSANTDKAYPRPWTVFAGTIVHDARGVTVFSAHEQSEMCGGTFDSIRDGVQRSVAAVNQHDDLVSALEAALPWLAARALDKSEDVPAPTLTALEAYELARLLVAKAKGAI